MYQIPDDPIISCIERTGYPQWWQDDEEEEERGLVEVVVDQEVQSVDSQKQKEQI